MSGALVLNEGDVVLVDLGGDVVEGTVTIQEIVTIDGREDRTVEVAWIVEV